MFPFFYVKNEKAIISFNLKEDRRSTKPMQRKIVMSVNLDLVIHSIFDLVMRDYVMSWYTVIAKDEERFYGHVECVICVT